MGEQTQLPLLQKRPSRRAALTVTQLVRTVRETLELTLDEFWVTGEVSNARGAPSGHLYFTLKDERSAINCVMFSSAYRRLRFKLTDGMEVIVRGRVNVYEARGAMQFYAEEMEPRGLGALQLAFEQLKNRLEADGLFDPSRKRPLPFLPRTIGIVTALRAAAIRDILTVILARFPNLHLIIRPARVQGPGAAADIADAIEDLNRDGRAEVIIVGRGGGSLEDLWAFNEEIVARAIYRSAIPIVSAVGHEIDYTIADFTADVRAPTPTAAAQLVVPAMRELSQRLAETEATLEGAIAGVIGGYRKEVGHVGARLRDPLGLIRDARQRVDEAGAALTAAVSAGAAASRRRVRELGLRLRGPVAPIRESRLSLSRIAIHLRQAATVRARRFALELQGHSARLEVAGRRAVELRRARFTELATRLDSISPLKVLERGYAVVTDPRDGRAIVDAATVAPGDELQIRLKRGRLRATANSREP
jgi:exodeoxyribonuclease VII large subunit